MRKSTERLRCTLSRQEKSEKTDELVSQLDKLELLKVEKVESAKKFAEDIKTKERVVRDLAYDVKSGTELRPVECAEKPQYGKSMVELIRLDTGEVLSSRPMSAEERQGAFDLESESDNAH